MAKQDHVVKLLLIEDSVEEAEQLISMLRNGGIDPTQWNGYAWGFGIERMAMSKHNVDDIRLFYESDLRFLEQF